MFEYLKLVKNYDKTNPNVFVFGLWEKCRWGLISFGQYIPKENNVDQFDVDSTLYGRWERHS